MTIIDTHHIPSMLNIHLKGKWLEEAGFETGITVKILEGCIVLMADNNEVQELREQLYQVW